MKTRTGRKNPTQEQADAGETLACAYDAAEGEEKKELGKKLDALTDAWPDADWTWRELSLAQGEHNLADVLATLAWENVNEALKKARLSVATQEIADREHNDDAFDRAQEIGCVAVEELVGPFEKCETVRWNAAEDAIRELLQEEGKEFPLQA